MTQSAPDPPHLAPAPAVANIPKGTANHEESESSWRPCCRRRHEPDPLRLLAAVRRRARRLRGGRSTPAGGEISYWLWDANQLPAYQQCADDFTKANPDITVKITQRGWDDYWTTLTNGFVAGTAPDVFTNHLSKYPEFAANKQLLPLDDAVAKDGIDLDQLQRGPGRALGGPGRQALRPAQGLGHRRACSTTRKLTDDAGITESQMKT